MVKSRLKPVVDVTAEELLRILTVGRQVVREHWKIKSMHWILDVVFSEDECRVLSVNGQKTLNILGKLTLLIHKQYIHRLMMKDSMLCNVLNSF